MDYAEKTQSATLVGREARVGNANRPTLSPLAELAERVQRLMSRVENMAGGMRGVTGKLNEHADTVFGERPASIGAEEARDVPHLGPNPYGGELGRVFNTLDGLNDYLNDLDRNLSYLAEAAGRNSTLA